MNDLVNIGFGSAGVVAILGYCVVFTGLILLMCVVLIMGKIMVKNAKKSEASAPAPAKSVPEPVKEKAQGTAGDVKLYDTDPKDAAMIMAIVADTLKKPLNELRFISIKEVKDE